MDLCLSVCRCVCICMYLGIGGSCHVPVIMYFAMNTDSGSVLAFSTLLSKYKNSIKVYCKEDSTSMAISVPSILG